GRSLDEGEEAPGRVSDDTEEMETILTSSDAASILTSGGVQVVPTAAEIARDAEIPRIHAEEELQIMIDGLDRNNETVAKFKRKGLRLEQESVKKLKTSEEVKATEEVSKEKVKEMIGDFPLLEQLLTDNEDKFSLLIQSDATTDELYAADEVKE
nr:hypothetical protein [Tanacetum cinerariifolium]